MGNKIYFTHGLFSVGEGNQNSDFTSKYEYLFAVLGLTSLKDMRVRGEFIQMFKFMKGLEVVEWEKQLKIKT